MKRNLAIQILCPLFLLIGAGNICQAQELEGKFRIRWRLNNIPDSVRGVMYVFNPTMTASKAIADFPLQNGEMIYEDTISQPKHLKFFGWAKDFPNWTLDLWVDRGGWIDIQGKDKWLHQWMITTNISQQKEALSYAACTADETDECLQMDEKCQVHDSLFWDRWHKLNYRSVRKTFEYMKTTPVTEVWIDQFLEKAWNTTENPDSLRSFRPVFQQLYARMPAEWQKTEKGKLIESYAFPAPTVEEGDDMADGLLYDAEGESHHLSELQGRYILLDFWSIYCGPCRMSEPEMEEIVHLYGDKLALVGISNDEKISWSKFLKEHKMPGYQWKEPKNGGRSLASRYKAGGIPHFVLISPEGKILKMWTGYRKGILKSKLKKFISEDTIQ